jgi:hypothetical protein
MNKHARIALNDTSGVDNEHVESVFESLKDRGKIPRNYATAYININSIRYKFDEIRELLNDKIFDLILVIETKLDHQFNDNLFRVDGYKLLRRDRDSRGGLIYIH